MSYTQAPQLQLRALAMQVVNNAQPKPPFAVLELLDGNLANPNSPLFQSLVNHLENQSRGQWRNGLNQTEIYTLIRGWAPTALQTVEMFLRQQQGQIGYPQPGFGGQMPQQGMYGGGFVQPMGNPTSNLYDSNQGGVPPQQPQTTVQTARPVPQTTPHMSSFETGRNIVFELNRAPVGDIITSSPIGEALRISNYMTCEYEKERLLSSNIALLMAQNTARDAGLLVQRIAPQEVMRGVYVNVMIFAELFHIPMAYERFKVVSETVTKLIDGPDWRTALATLRKREYDEFKTISDALSVLISQSMYRRMRLSSGQALLGIDSIDDLATLDDRNADFDVVRHAGYWTTFNGIVSKALQNLFTPDHLIGPQDKNFGDFINCDAINYYKDGRTKFDYGTFRENADYKQFIDGMLSVSTVVRIPRVMILTNALDPQLIARVKAGSAESQSLLHKITTVGTTLIGKLDSPKREEIYSVVCLDKSRAPNLYCEQINVGRTLDEDLVLLP